jgi:abortive infection bacteriophage resistance protein
VAQLASRGLVVNDRAAAQAFLSHINYYRFGGYCLAFEKQRHVFRDGVTFEQVRASYEFDLALRDLVTEALEVLEVDFRAAIAYDFGQRHGAFSTIWSMSETCAPTTPGCGIGSGRSSHHYRADRYGIRRICHPIIGSLPRSC